MPYRRAFGRYRQMQTAGLRFRKEGDLPPA